MLIPTSNIGTRYGGSCSPRGLLEFLNCSSCVAATPALCRRVGYTNILPLPRPSALISCPLCDSTWSDILCHDNHNLLCRGPEPLGPPSADLTCRLNRRSSHGHMGTWAQGLGSQASWHSLGSSQAAITVCQVYKIRQGLAIEHDLDIDHHNPSNVLLTPC